MMIIYNAFPLAYQDIEQITHQIPKLAYMGVKMVWFNPFQNGRRMLEYPGGSLYSMSNEDLFVSHWRGGDKHQNEKALAGLKEQADKHGIDLMFDLVMNQVGRRLQKVQDHKHLFKDPNRGEFDFSTFESRCEIFNVFFKPFIKRYVKQYGFTGMRIDAAGAVPAHMQKMAIDYFRYLCKKHHQKDGTVLGEFLEDNNKLQPLKDMQVQYDLITNSTHWTVDTSPFFDGGKRAAHNPDMSQRRELAKQGTIGWTGNHDLETLHDSCAKKLPKNTFLSIQSQNYMLAKMMREKIAVQALISDGGYYLLCGDEYGSPQRRNCFEWEGQEGEPALRDHECYWKNWGGKFDMVDFIAQINSIRNNLPAVDPHFWSEQYTLNSYLDPHNVLKCIVRNNGGDFSGPMDIILVNVDPKQPLFEIDNRFIDNIKAQIKDAHPHFDWHKNSIRIHLAGSIKVNGKLDHPYAHAEVAKENSKMEVQKTYVM